MNPALTGTNMGVEWFAITSTATTRARDNAVVGAGVPVFLLDGTTKVADGFADMWDGTIDAAISLNQFTASVVRTTWTGATQSGSFGTHPLGGASGFGIRGRSDLVSASWIDQSFSGQSNLRAVYALSEQLAVVPEPSTAVLLLIGCGVVVWTLRGRRAVRT